MEFYDNVYKSMGMGSISSQMQNTFGGIDYRNKGMAISTNKDTNGLVFFTRPRLNLSYHNLTPFPEFKTWLTEDENSIHKNIRALLDPVGNNERFRRAYMTRFGLEDNNELPPLNASLVDPLNPFIPLLTSNVLTLSGWMDRRLTPKTTEEGLGKESITIPDGIYAINGAYDLNATFRSLSGDPITMMMSFWCEVISAIRFGRPNFNFINYLDSTLNREMPYTTAIYRVVLDGTKRYVRKMAVTGMAWPVATNEASVFDYDRSISKPDEESKSVQFACSGALYNHPTIPVNFNRLVAMYNPNMRPVDTRVPNGDLVGVATGAYKKLLTEEEISLNNTFAYPRINTETMEFELFAPVNRR